MCEPAPWANFPKIFGFFAICINKHGKCHKNIYLYISRRLFDSEMYPLDLKDLQLDLDDDLFLYSPSNEYWSIWEFYEIHETRPKKILYYGNWHLKEGLSITNEDKWVRRKNLEVCVVESCQSIKFFLSPTYSVLSNIHCL